MQPHEYQTYWYFEDKKQPASIVFVIISQDRAHWGRREKLLGDLTSSLVCIFFLLCDFESIPSPFEPFTGKVESRVVVPAGPGGLGTKLLHLTQPQAPHSRSKLPRLALSALRAKRHIDESPIELQCESRPEALIFYLWSHAWPLVEKNHSC